MLSPNELEEAKNAFCERLLELNKTMTWEQISKLPDFQGVPPGSLHAYAHGREVTNPILRDQFGLPPYESCGQCWRFNEYIPQIRAFKNRHKPKSLSDYSKKTLSIMFINREVVQDAVDT